MNEQTSRIHEPDSSARVLYVSPRDVLENPEMTLEEKRALLASWASDARAVANAPALRQLDNGAIVLIDDVLDALKQLDTPAGTPSRSRLPLSLSKPDKLRWPSALAKLGLKGRDRHRDDDDDDNPPPCPVAVRPPRPLPTLDAACAA
jgi:hypothetical protein